MDNIFHPNFRIIINLRMLRHQFPGHNRHIPRRGIMLIGIRQAAAIFEMGIIHPKFLRPLVHQLHKFLFASRYVLCHCHAGIIPRCHRNTFYHRFQCLHLTFFQKNLGSSHGFGIGTGNNIVLQLNPSRVQMVEYNKQGHNFCDAGRAAPHIRFLLTNHLPRRSLHHKIRRGRHFRSRLHTKHRAYQQIQTQHPADSSFHQSFHITHSRQVFYYYKYKKTVPVRTVFLILNIKKRISTSGP